MAVNLFWEAFLPTESELEYFSMCGKQSVMLSWK